MNPIDVDPMPIRDGAGKRNLDLFLLGSKPYPVCFYFEDEGSEELYKRFLKRIFPNYNDPLVVCTGGKTNDKFLDEADEKNLKNIVFIQDKDFDDLIGVLPTDHRIVMLNRYSFENYLLDPGALIEIAIESKRRLKREDAERNLSLDNYFVDLHESYKPLGELFVVARKLNLKGVKTTKQSIADFLSPNSSLVSSGDLMGIKAEISKKAIASQRVANLEEFEKMVAPALQPKPKYCSHADNHPNAHLCGKHLLELTLCYLDEKIGTDLGGKDRFEMAMRLVLHVSVSIFDRVKGEIIKSLENQGASEDVIKRFA